MRHKQLSLYILLIWILKYIRSQNFSIEGRYIFNNEEVFTALGINYSPIPIGASQSYPESDYGDVYSDSWNFLHRRDVPLLRNMGVNSIRVYNWYPWKFPSPESPVYNEEEDNPHTNFLDMLWNDGDDPIYIWVPYHIPPIFHYKVSAVKLNDRESWRLRTGEWAYVDPEYEEEDSHLRQIIKNAYKTIAEHYGNHPAVIGFVLGNERNDEYTRGNPIFWNYLNELGEMLKQLAPNKLTMVSIVDDGLQTVREAEAIGLLNYIDVWGINSYRGTVDQGFDVLFTSYAEMSNKPLLITEYGPPASTRSASGEAIILPDNAQAQADYIKVHFDDMIAHRHICSGGYIFEYVDEWWKNIDPNKQDPNNAPNPSYPGGYGDEEYFGIYGVKLTEGNPEDYKTRVVDTLEARAAVRTITEMFHGFNGEIPPQEPMIPMQPIEPYTPFVQEPDTPNFSPTPNPPKSQPQASPQIGPQTPPTSTPTNSPTSEPIQEPDIGGQDEPELVGSEGNSVKVERKIFFIAIFLVLLLL